MNGHRIHFYREVSAYSLFHTGETVEIEYVRDGEKYTAVLTPKYDEESGRYLYGLIGNYAYTKGNVLDSAVNSFYEVHYWIYTTLQSLKMLLTGGASVNDLSGPVGIVQNMGEVYDESVSSGGYYAAFINMLNWVVLLSANLGVMNLLPIPALDGGRLVFLLVEAVRRKRIDPEKEGYVHLVGIILLMLLMVFVMFNDIRKLF
jgi:regulator of sigma E protease